MRRTFETVSDELLECAEAAASHFEELGYHVAVEEAEIGFPYAPTLVCRRQRTWLAVEVVARCERDRVQEWIAYGKSSGRDFRVALCTVQLTSVSQTDEEMLRTAGIGWYVFANDRLSERVSAGDLGLNVQLPNLASLPKKARAALGAAYEQFGKSLWREGFQSACQAFEVETRKYLRRHSKRMRVASTKGSPTSLDLRRLEKMTMGNLASVFETIQNKNRDDAKILKALKAVIRERNAVVHHKGTAPSERKLRENVPRHMWCLADVMRVVIQ